MTHNVCMKKRTGGKASGTRRGTIPCNNPCRSSSSGFKTLWLCFHHPYIHLATFCCTYYQLQCKLNHTTSSTDWLPKLLHCSVKFRPHSSWPQSPHLMALTCTVQLPINSLGFYSIILNMNIWVWVWGWGSYLIWETFSPRATSQGTPSCIYLSFCCHVGMVKV